MTAPAEPTTPPVTDKTFTQAEVDAIAARALSDGNRQGKQAQEQAIKDALGCTLDEAKQILADKKTADDAALTEAQRLQKAAEDRETAATAKEQAAEARILAADVRAELILQGAGAGVEDAKERAAILADAAKLVDVAAGADEAAIRAAVETVKKRHAGMFTAAGSTGTPHTATGTGPTKTGAGPKSLTDIAKEHGFLAATA